MKKNKIQNDEMSYYDCGVEVEEIGKALGGKNRSRSGLMNENDLDMNLINAWCYKILKYDVSLMIKIMTQSAFRGLIILACFNQFS